MSGISILRGFLLGMYFSLDIVLSAVLGIIYARQKRSGRVIPSLLLGGLALLTDGLSVVLHPVHILVVGNLPIFDYIFSCADLLVTSLFFFTGLSLFTAKFPSRRAVLRVSAPALAIYLLLVLTANKLVFSALTVLWLVMLFVALVRRMRRYNSSLVFFYSNVNNHRNVWFLLILIWSFAIYPLYKLAYVGAAHADLYYAIYSLSSMALYAILSYLITTQTIDSDITSFYADVLEDSAADEEASRADDSAQPRITVDTLLSATQQRVMEERLKGLMADDKLYRNSDLCVDDLVSQLATNSSYFYYFMRDVMKVSFLDYVNGFRVNEAKELLTRGEKIDLVAGRVGFNSANSFRRAFKRATGLTPSEWREARG